MQGKLLTCREKSVIVETDRRALAEDRDGRRKPTRGLKLGSFFDANAQKSRIFRLFVFLGIDAGAKVVYTEYRQTGGSPEVVAGGRKPERGLKLRFVFVKKLKQKGPEFPDLFA